MKEQEEENKKNWKLLQKVKKFHRAGDKRKRIVIYVNQRIRKDLKYVLVVVITNMIEKRKKEKVRLVQVQKKMMMILLQGF